LEFKDTIKYIEVNDNGKITRMVGAGKAKDFQRRE
jgi:hypothetical protein